MAKTFFLRFIDDGFGIMEGSKKDVEYWIKQFNGLRKTIKIDKWSFGNSAEYMDIYIQRRKVFLDRTFGFSYFPKRNQSIYVYPCKKRPCFSHHQKLRVR